MMCKRASYIIICLISAVGKLLEFRYNKVIASLSACSGTHKVVYFFSSVKAQNNIMHIFIYILLFFIIKKYSVCCNCKSKVFAMQFFLFTSVLNYFLYNLKVHERFSPEEVNLKIASVSAVGYYKINGFLTDFCTH